MVDFHALRRARRVVLAGLICGHCDSGTFHTLDDAFNTEKLNTKKRA